jgi:CRP-like cAMP-binding protein
MPDRHIELLQKMPIFGGIREDTLRFLIAASPVVQVRADDYYFREHDRAESMFVLEAGRVAVLKNWDGADRLLCYLGQGDCFGEMALMDLAPRSASVRAVEDSTALELSAASLYELYKQDVEQFAMIEMNMGREVCRRLREIDDQLFRMQMRARAEGVTPEPE